jgi:translocation and assembly module TamA
VVRLPAHALAAAAIALAAALVSSGCRHAEPRPDGSPDARPPDAPVVKDIRIDGTRRLDEDDIKRKILTTETPWWGRIWPFNEVHTFDANAWQADLRRIERYYQAQGYYQAEVLESEVLLTEDDGVKLRVRVEEGEPTTISRVEIRGLEALPADHRRAALEDLPLREGQVFHEEDWAGLKGKIQTALHELGYAEANVQGEVAVDVDTRRAEVLLRIRPGQRYRFGSIFVAQDDRPKVPAKQIIEQAQGAIRPDAWYSETALAEAQARVFRMGVFGGVKVNRGAPDREAGRVPVVVDVREAPFHTEKYGGGVGVDQTRSEARVLAEYTDRNFLGGLRRLTLSAKTGYAFIPSAFNPVRHGVMLDALAELEQPRFLFRDLRAQATVGFERGLEQAFEFYDGRVRLGAIWQPQPELSFFPSYNLELYRLAGEATRLGSEQVGLGCIPDETGTCNFALSYVEVVVEYDRRDNFAEPRHGWYGALSLQGGGGPLLGSYSYLRFQPDLRAYASFLEGDRLTVAARLRLGTLIPLGSSESTPIVTRFYSGGGSSMRGFSNRRLSPMLLSPVEDAGDGVLSPIGGLPAETIPVGGNGLLESSLEVRYRFSTNLVVAAFLDAGFVSTGQFDFARPSYLAEHLLYAVGMGLRYLTPIGPLRVDVAYRLNIGRPLPLQGPPYLRPLVSSGCFGLFPTSTPDYAGSPEGQCAFHLSIGEAF